MKHSLLTTGFAALLSAGALTTPAAAADEAAMLDACKARAARQLRVGAELIIVRYDGQRVDRTHAVNGGVAMAQLGVEPERLVKILKRWSGWLRDRPETIDYLARSRRAKVPSK